MKSYLLSSIILLLMTLGSISAEAQASPGPPDGPRNPSYTLYPVTNFTVDWVEVGRYLTWQQPELPGGGVPPGLIGYRVYRQG